MRRGFAGRVRFSSLSMRPASGVRVVAVFEAAKGALVLFAGFGLVELIHRGAQHVAEEFVRHSHLNPASEYPRIFLRLVENTSDRQLWLFAGLAAAYTSVRFVEAYGLWRGRRWAEWFAAASGGIYIPIEIYELWSHVSWIKVCVLLVNAGIVAYMSYALWQSKQNRATSPDRDIDVAGR